MNLRHPSFLWWCGGFVLSNCSSGSGTLWYEAVEVEVVVVEIVVVVVAVAVGTRSDCTEVVVVEIVVAGTIAVAP